MGDIITIDFQDEKIKKENLDLSHFFFSEKVYEIIDFSNEKAVENWTSAYQLNFEDASDAILDFTDVDPFNFGQ